MCTEVSCTHPTSACLLCAPRQRLPSSRQESGASKTNGEKHVLVAGNSFTAITSWVPQPPATASPAGEARHHILGHEHDPVSKLIPYGTPQHERQPDRLPHSTSNRPVITSKESHVSPTQTVSVTPVPFARPSLSGHGILQKNSYVSKHKPPTA